MAYTPSVDLPHHRLHAYGVACELLAAVRAAHLADRRLREQALNAAKSACLNCAEGAGRVTRADKARAFVIARGEAGEAAPPPENGEVLDRPDQELKLPFDCGGARFEQLLDEPLQLAPPGRIQPPGLWHDRRGDGSEGLPDGVEDHETSLAFIRSLSPR